MVDKATPWSGGYVGINSFGLGGINVHVLLKSANDSCPKRTADNPHPAASVPRLVTCCGRTKEGVEKTLNYAMRFSKNVELQELLESAFGQLPTSAHPYRGFTLVNSSRSWQAIEVIQCTLYLV